MCPNVTSLLGFSLFCSLLIYRSLCVENKEDIDMTEVKTFKIEKTFDGTEDLYKYLLKNVEFIRESIGMQIQKPIRNRMFCLTGKEKITERQILFYASKGEFHECMGELIISAGTFDVDIIVFFIPKLTKARIEPLNWLQKISNVDTEFIICEIDF